MQDASQNACQVAQEGGIGGQNLNVDELRPCDGLQGRARTSLLAHQ